MARKSGAFRAALFGLVVAAVMLGACQPATPQVVEVTRQVEVTHEVVVQQTVEVQSTVEVPVEQAPTRQADRAVELGKQFAGTTVTIRYEDVQAGAVHLFAPQWEEATGMKINVVEVPYADQYTLGLQDGAAKDGSVDLFLTTYSWIPDWVAAGTITPIDAWVQQHMTDEDLADIEEVHGLYLTNYDGKMWGLPVDGDAFIMYYRKDLFEDEAYKAAFQEKYGRELTPPANFEEYAQVAEFFNTYTNGKVLGFAEQRDAASTFFWFLQYYQSTGGKLFDPDTMKPLLTEPAALDTVKWMLQMQDYGAPGNGSWSFPEVWGNFLTGNLAMAITWPPLGRFAEAASGLSNYPTWLPATAVAGKVGYAPSPFGHSELASNYVWTINANSQNQDAAFAFMMWWSSPDLATTISLLPNSLGDPLRYSQYNSTVYRTHWPGADKYLDTLLAGARCGTPDIKIPGGGEYQETLGRRLAEVWTGAATPEQALDEATADWEAITDRLGRDKQSAAYKDLLSLVDKAGGYCKSS